jgi:putative transcriptional regulator
VSADLLESAIDLAASGLIDKTGLARVHALCFESPPSYSPRRVAEIRKRKARMSQSVFAMLLNVSLSTVQKWEAPSAGKRPSGAAAKPLQVIERNGVDALV